MPEFVVSRNCDGRRLDVCLSLIVPEITRSMFHKLIVKGYVTLNGELVKPSHKVRVGDIVEYQIPPAEPTDIIPQEIPIDVIYEDLDLIVINKPNGMVVHPAPGVPSNTVVNALLARCGRLSGVGGIERPGIVHRLDKDTSGLMVVAKNDVAHQALQKQIQARTAERRYFAFVWGDPCLEETLVDAPIGRHPSNRQKMAVIQSGVYRSRPAVTHLRVLERLGPITLIEARLGTGRTHQIRVHCSCIGHPVVGDPVYSGGRRLQSGPKLFVETFNRFIDGLGGQALHAYYLSFCHPRTSVRLEFVTSIPERMQVLLDFIARERIG